MNLSIVGLKKESAIHIVNMLADSLHAYTSLPSLGENFKYLMIVSQTLLMVSQAGKWRMKGL